MIKKLTLICLIITILLITWSLGNNTIKPISIVDVCTEVISYVDVIEESEIPIVSEDKEVCIGESYNISCSIIQSEIKEEPIITKKEVVENICKQNRLILVDETERLDYLIFIEGYKCVLLNDTTTLCESIYDYPDGVCQSGESCIKIIYDGKDYKQYERNSQDEWKDNDPSYIQKKMILNKV
jgi:hypothetical protein